MRCLPFVLLLALLGLTACSSKPQSDVYTASSVGQVSRVIPATVVSWREVVIQGNSEVGTPAGAAAGAVVGSRLGGDARTNIIGAIGGAIIGGITGKAADKRANRHPGIEYILKTDQGELLTIVQGEDVRLAVGQPVYIMMGRQSRIVARTDLPPEIPAPATENMPQRSAPQRPD